MTPEECSIPGTASVIITPMKLKLKKNLHRSRNTQSWSMGIAKQVKSLLLRKDKFVIFVFNINNRFNRWWQRTFLANQFNQNKNIFRDSLEFVDQL